MITSDFSNIPFVIVFVFIMPTCDSEQVKLSAGYFKRLKDDYSKQIEESGLRNISEKELALLYNNRGHSMYMQVEFDSAMDDYNKALEYDPMLAVALYNRGTVQYRMGNFEAALEDMEKALSLDSCNAEIIDGFNECKRILGEKRCR
ncbi:hypothetical protein J437_LFUL014816 [Ladona fulva]|uniref:Tetratricopeptide repeat protein n=1 Tax=Ladona fulva TaxID=123851 RepID=A0A8K0KU86_LADFU|nr:hypothetical protein J437_LFUL014816 [Ladona fulva]